jgi:hypothetical protein
MIKAGKPPRSSRLKGRLERLFVSIGKGHLDPFQRFGLQLELQQIGAAYAERRGQLTAEQRRLLRKFRSSTAKRQALRRRLAPISEEIVLAGWLREDPDADEDGLRAVLADLEDYPEIVIPRTVEAKEDLDIAFLLDRKGDYRKRKVRKLAIEPFLQFLTKHKIKSSPKKLPLIRMVRALLDWLEISQGRPTDTGVRTIVREFKRRRSARR